MSQTGTAKQRKVVLAVLLGVVVLIGGFVVKIVLFLSAQPTVSTDYTAEYNERVRPADSDPNGNAAPYYENAFARLPSMPEDISHIGRLRDHDPSSVEWKIVESWLTSCDDALALLHPAAAKPWFWGEVPSVDLQSPIAARDRYFNGFREASFCLRFEAEYLAAKGDTPGAFRCLTTLCRMANHLSGSGRMYAGLGQVLEMLAHLRTFELLRQAEYDSALLADVQRQLGDVLAAKRPPAFGGDEIVLRDVLQRSFTDDGKGDGHVIPGVIYDPFRRSRKPRNELEADMAYLKYFRIAWAHPTRRQTIRAVEALTQSANQLLEESPWALHARGTSYEDQLKEAVEGNFFLESHGVDAMLARRIIGHYETQVSMEALITTVAALRYHGDKGAWPGSLEELATAGYIRRMPVDPYSGEPLVYKPAGGSFTLYSFGRDFDDDGGMPSTWGNPPQGGDQVFWPIEERRK